MADPRFNLPLLADRAVAATYVESAFTVSGLTGGGFDVAYSPTASDPEHVALTVLGSGWVTCIEALATRTLPQGPEVEVVGEALAYQIDSILMQEIADKMASAGIAVPGWIVVEGGVRAEVTTALPTHIVESEAEVQMDEEGTTATTDLKAGVLAGTHTLAVSNATTSLSSIASGTSGRQLRVRGFYASGSEGSETWTEGNCLGFFSNLHLFDRDLDGLGIIASLRAAARSTPSIEFFVKFSIWTPAASGSATSDTSSRGSLVPVPNGTVVHICDVASGTPIASGEMTSDGYVKFDISGTPTTSVPRSRFSGYTSVCFRVEYSSTIQRQYVDKTAFEQTGQLSWSRTTVWETGVWETTLAESEGKVAGKIDDIYTSTTTMYGSATAPLEFRVGTNLFLHVTYAVSTSTGKVWRPAPAGLPVQVWDATPSVDATLDTAWDTPSSSTPGYLGTFYTDKFGSIHGTILKRRSSNASLALRVPLTLREFSSSLRWGAGIQSETGSTTLYALDMDRLYPYATRAQAAYGLGLTNPPEAGSKVSIGLADKPFGMMIGYDKAVGGIYGILSGAAVFALRAVSDGNNWWKMLTSGASTSWGSMLTTWAPAYKVVLQKSTSATTAGSTDADVPSDHTQQFPVSSSIYYSGDCQVSVLPIWSRSTYVHEFTHFLIAVVLKGINQNHDFDDESSNTGMYRAAKRYYNGDYEFSGAATEPDNDDEGTERQVLTFIQPQESKYAEDTYTCFAEGFTHMAELFFADPLSDPDTFYNDRLAKMFKADSNSASNPHGPFLRTNFASNSPVLTFSSDVDPLHTSFKHYHWNRVADSMTSSNKRLRLIGNRIISCLTFSLFGPLRNTKLLTTGPGRHFDAAPPTGSTVYYDDSAPKLRLLTEPASLSLNWEDVTEGSAILETASSTNLARVQSLFEHLIWRPLLLLQTPGTFWVDWNSAGSATAVDYPNSTAFLLAIDAAWFTGDPTACSADIQRVKNWLVFNNLRLPGT